MARTTRALILLLTTLGVALAVSSTSATAANGGATPEAVVSGGAGGAGGAAPGQAPRDGSEASGKSSARQTGGAIPGRTPAKPVKPPPVRRRTPAAPTRPSRPVAPVVPVVPEPEPPAAPVVPTVAGVFPVGGSYSFGERDARFGAGRPGHVHQGQDVLAASGTPVLSPVDGVVAWKANQPGGAGIYLVVRATADGRDYVFMHLKRGSVLVAPGDTVAGGEQLAQVGATGRASGPHLHFEIWIGGWQARGGAPIDPLAQLERWAGS